MSKVSCAAACKYADLHKELCLKDHITILYRTNSSDWPCQDFQPMRVSSEEFANTLLDITKSAR